MKCLGYGKIYEINCVLILYYLNPQGWFPLLPTVTECWNCAVECRFAQLLPFTDVHSQVWSVTSPSEVDAIMPLATPASRQAIPMTYVPAGIFIVEVVLH